MVFIGFLSLQQFLSWNSPRQGTNYSFCCQRCPMNLKSTKMYLENRQFYPRRSNIQQVGATQIFQVQRRGIRIQPSFLVVDHSLISADNVRLFSKDGSTVLPSPWVSPPTSLAMGCLFPNQLRHGFPRGGKERFSICSISLDIQHKKSTY